MPRKTSAAKSPKSSRNKQSTALLLDSQITAAAISARRRRGERTQAERSSEMRLRVLDATITCLEKLGYAETSFGTIAKEAGASRGALQHHYPEKNFVIAGALEMMIHRIEEEFRDKAIHMSDGPHRMAFVMDRLWQATISPQLRAVADIRVAARTDSTLRTMLVPLEHRIRERHYTVIGEALGGDLSTAPGFTQRVDAVLGTMRGLNNQLAYGWKLEEIQAAWDVARNDFIAGFKAAAVSPKQSRKSTRATVR